MLLLLDGNSLLKPIPRPILGRPVIILLFMTAKEKRAYRAFFLRDHGIRGGRLRGLGPGGDPL